MSFKGGHTFLLSLLTKAIVQTGIMNKRFKLRVFLNVFLHLQSGQRMTSSIDISTIQ